MTGVTSDVGVPSTRLVFLWFPLLFCDQWSLQYGTLWLAYTCSHAHSHTLAGDCVLVPLEARVADTCNTAVSATYRAGASEVSTITWKWILQHLYYVISKPCKGGLTKFYVFFITETWHWFNFDFRRSFEIAIDFTSSYLGSNNELVFPYWWLQNIYAFKNMPTP